MMASDVQLLLVICATQMGMHRLSPFPTPRTFEQLHEQHRGLEAKLVPGIAPGEGPGHGGRRERLQILHSRIMDKAR